MMIADNDLELTTNEAAILLDLSPGTLRKWRCTGEHPALHWQKRFRKVYYLKSDVIAFKNENTQKSSEKTLI